MRRARRLLLLAAGLLAVLVAALWVAPRLLDWNNHRATIEALASASLGREVRIEGPISLNVLPEAALSAEGVRVVDAGDGIAITAQQLRLRVALAPLLTGKLDPRELELLSPQIAVPWPPARDARAVQPPDWLTDLSARITDGRIHIGNAEFTQVNATLATGGDGEGMSLAGTATWRGNPLRFATALSRAGFDGSAVLEARAELMGSAFTYTGTLAADGALEGRFAASGDNIARWMPAPPASFRAQGRLTGAGGLLAADELEADVGGARAQGAVALRLTPTPRLDVAIAAGRIDLAAWAQALVGEAGPPLPMGLDLSAEGTEVAGGQLRRVRLTLDLGREAVTVREASAVLPGEAQLRLAGQIRRGETPRFEGSMALDAGALRATLGWLGWSPDWLPPLALRRTQFSARLAADAGSIALSGIDGRLDESSVTGGLGVRSGTRPSVDIGLTFDRLALDPWIAALPDPRQAAGPAELALRLSAKTVEVAGMTVQDGALDVGIDGPRVQLRRLEAAIGGGRFALSGALGDGGRIADGLADLSLPEATTLMALVPPEYRGSEAMWRGAMTLKVQASGPPETLGVRLNLELGDLRLEAMPTVDIPGRRMAGPLTLRHPGAPRALDRFGFDTAAWLGDGSLALIAQLVATPQRIVAENFDLAAGALRTRGALTLDLGARPKLAGRVAAEVLTLPLPYVRDPTPVAFAALRNLDAEVAITADQLLLGQSPVLSQIETTMRLQRGVLELAPLTAKLGGGALTARLALDTTAPAPALAMDAQLRGAQIAGPLLDGVPDLSGGTVDLELESRAGGHSALALISSLTGKVRVSARDGTFNGFALRGVRDALALPDAASIPPAVEAALAEGSTEFARLEVGTTLDRGVIVIDTGTLQGSGGAARLGGSFDLTRGQSELTFAITPDAAGAPPIGLTLSGPPETIRRQTDLTALLRWLAER